MLDHNVHECGTLLIAEKLCLCGAAMARSSRLSPALFPFPGLSSLGRRSHDLLLRSRLSYLVASHHYSKAKKYRRQDKVFADSKPRII
jgi:hypothetical protein